MTLARLVLCSSPVPLEHLVALLPRLVLSIIALLCVTPLAEVYQSVYSEVCECKPSQTLCKYKQVAQSERWCPFPLSKFFTNLGKNCTNTSGGCFLGFLETFPLWMSESLLGFSRLLEKHEMTMLLYTTTFSGPNLWVGTIF